MDYEEKIAKAEKKEADARKYRESLQRVAIAEREIPTIWDTGEVSVIKLSETYGISPVTVKRILNSAGRVIKRVKKLSAEERAEVSALIQQGEHINNLAAKYKVSQNTIRRAGLDSGVLVKGQRRPKRTDAEYEVIRAWDAETRSRFAGAGLYNLGLGLKAYDHKKKLQDKALARATSEPQPVDEAPILPPEEAYPAVYEGPDEPPTPGVDEAAHPAPEADHSPADVLPDSAPEPDPTPAPEETPNYNF